MAAVTVLNAGGWGTALACLLAERGHEVALWVRRPALAVELSRVRENAVYLPGVALPAAVAPTSDIAAAVDGTQAVVVATPMRGLRELGLHLTPVLPTSVPVLIGTKGLEPETWLRPTQVLASALGGDNSHRLAALSGPTHAEEVARGLPTAAVVACADPAVARDLQAILSTPAFRLYSSADMVGVELCAAAKNVIALAAGVADGLDCGDNGKAALVTRSLAELGRLVAAYGGLPDDGEPAWPASAISSPPAPASTAATAGPGEQLGRGRPSAEVLASTPMVVEGVPGDAGCHRAGAGRRRELPICEAVHRVLYEGQPPRAAIADLLTRALTAETPASD